MQNNALTILNQLYEKIDKDVDLIPKVCKKGCAFCCSQPIEILKIEKVILRDYI